MSNVHKIGKAGAVPVVLALLLAFPAGFSGAHSQGRVTVSIGFGGFFGVPAYVGFGGLYYPAQYPPGIYAPPPSRPYYAFVDTDIHPEEASLYLDGRLIGIADDFDGYPGYLAVKPGRHTLLFRYQGFQSLSFKLELRAGEMVQLDRKLPRIAPGEKEVAPPPVPDRENVPEGTEAEGKASEQNTHGTLRLEVSPPGARVILDGDFFGTGAEISRLHVGIPLSPGIHRIRVSLAGYRSKAVETEIVASRERTLQISLSKE